MHEDVGDFINELKVDDVMNDVVSDEEGCHETELEDDKLLVVVLLVEKLLTAGVNVLLIFLIVIGLLVIVLLVFLCVILDAFAILRVLLRLELGLLVGNVAVGVVILAPFL